MSGHSHFKTIKAQKGIADAKKGEVFSKIARLITIAAKDGGDPTANPKLRIAIEQAKEANLPKENVERAIKKGTGELAGEKLEEVVFESFGPGGIAIIVEGITDNKNRTLGEIKQILNQGGGKLGGEGSVRWMFDRKGVITINFQFPWTQNGLPEGLLSLDAKRTPRRVAFQKKEDLELLAIEAGAEDIYWQEDLLDIYTKPEDLEKIKKTLEGKGIKIESASLGWVEKETIEVGKKEKESCQKLFEALNENEAVQDIYSNLKL